MKVKLKKNYIVSDGRKYDLEFGKEYEILGIESDYYRIIDGNGEPVLYAPECFIITDANEPKEWVTEYGEGGERYSYDITIR